MQDFCECVRQYKARVHGARSRVLEVASIGCTHISLSAFYMGSVKEGVAFCLYIYFMIYLTKSPIAPTTQRRIVGSLLNNKLQCMRTEAVVA